MYSLVDIILVKKTNEKIENGQIINVDEYFVKASYGDLISMCNQL